MWDLSSKGFRLTHCQDPRLEYDYSIRNLAVDLRNGLRICRMVELLSGVNLRTLNLKLPLIVTDLVLWTCQFPSPELSLSRSNFAGPWLPWQMLAGYLTDTCVGFLSQQ